MAIPARLKFSTRRQGKYKFPEPLSPPASLYCFYLGSGCSRDHRSGHCKTPLQVRRDKSAAGSETCASRSNAVVQSSRMHGRIDASYCLIFNHMEKRSSRQNIAFFSGAISERFIGVKRIPINSVESTPRGLKTGGLSLGREQHYTAPTRVKSIAIIPHRRLFLLQLSTSQVPKYLVHAKFEAKSSA